MGKYRNTGLFKCERKITENFNSSSEVYFKVKELEENLKLKISIKSNEENEEKLKNEYVLNKGIIELKKAKVKFNEKDVIFVVRDKSGQLIWLEKGDLGVGLNHIFAHHENDFLNKFGANKDEIPYLIKDIILKSKILYEHKEYRNGILCLTKIYLYKDKHLILGAIGSNGFISSIYPIDEEEYKRDIKKWEKMEKEKKKYNS